jgi:phosphoribosylformylglycinamidine synthase
VRRLGTSGGDALEVEGQFALGLDQIRTTWQAPIPTAMAAAGH